MKSKFYLILILFLLFSCKQNDNDIDFGYDYFPMDKGSFVVYEVTQISHDINLNPQHDTLKYTLETVVGEEIVDNSGRPAREFFQYKYDLSSGELLDKRVWTKVIDGKRGEVVEENQRKIRMIFPVKEEDSWNVNAFNPEDAQVVYYENANEARTIGGFVLENTAKIVYDDFLTLVDYRKSHDTYAKGIGLVERKRKYLAINSFDTLNINRGDEIHYKLLDYGKK